MGKSADVDEDVNRRAGLALRQPAYDNIYQLTNVLVGNNQAEHYTYDAVGNRLTSVAPATTYTNNDSNELTATSAATYTYDYNGNATSKTDTNGTTYYTWDYENRLSSVTLPGTGGTVNFKYDPLGRRIEKIAPGATTIYAYDTDGVIAELDGSSNILARYTQGENTDEPLAIYRGLTTSYFHADGLGSVTSLTDGSGQLAASYVYDSFGKLTASTGSLTNPFQYTGREFDSEIGLYYYRARYYDPNAGRFISEDPIRFAGSSDFYVYVQNKPIIGKDPTGLMIKICSRPAFRNRVTGSIGNHAFLLDTRNGNNCSKGSGNWPNGSESEGNHGTFCVPVPGSDGLEEKVMNCCKKKAGSFMGKYVPMIPYMADCHDLTRGCLKDAGLPDTPAPGDRIGCRGNCPSAAPLEAPTTIPTDRGPVPVEW
ncbi:MAG: RHS repeat-associated core domain-containing protein [Acidobacteriota bacterium]|nr:RHS repeat-associated core domain-containing protein [Acidobacteriota bacterium]